MPDPVIIQVPGDTPVQRQLDLDPPAPLARGEVVVEVLEADADGTLNPPPTGEVVLSVPSPESLSREREEVRRVLADAGTGVEPLVVVIEVAAEIRDAELAPVLDGAAHAPRPVILRIIRSV